MLEADDWHESNTTPQHLQLDVIEMFEILNSLPIVHSFACLSESVLFHREYFRS